MLLPETVSLRLRKIWAAGIRVQLVFVLFLALRIRGQPVKMVILKTLPYNLIASS